MPNTNNNKLVVRIQREIYEWISYLEENFGAFAPVDYLMLDVYEAYFFGNLNKSKTERDPQVSRLIGRKHREYSGLVKRTLARAKAEFPVRSLTDEDLSEVVKRAVFEAVAERLIAVANAPVWLDTFNDVIWPRVLRSISQALGVECEIDESAYQRWIDSEGWKYQS